MLEEITTEEAARRLKRHLVTVQGAVQRGALTLSPRSNRGRHLLYQDQVKLFEGKEISLTALSTEEYARWLEIADQATASKQQRANLQEMIDRVLPSPKSAAVVR